MPRRLTQQRLRQLQIKSAGLTRQTDVLFFGLALRRQSIGRAIHQQLARHTSAQAKSQDQYKQGQAWA